MTAHGSRPFGLAGTHRPTRGAAPGRAVPALRAEERGPSDAIRDHGHRRG
ncbi:hypothetical protein FTUN_7164 [Frigoriglobus tundricola]|uniref:Uncharacterized protein n=1 Tax=Frigoriglobus tundricola TaxID=2774151 RepID=A0A6M5Z2X7_9BACT|nr:hypothetical protein FTUN_7164 [Frigoriglobus tundricola]